MGWVKYWYRVGPPPRFIQDQNIFPYDQYVCTDSPRPRIVKIHFHTGYMQRAVVRGAQTLRKFRWWRDTKMVLDRSRTSEERAIIRELARERDERWARGEEVAIDFLAAKPCLKPINIRRAGGNANQGRGGQYPPPSRGIWGSL